MLVPSGVKETSLSSQLDLSLKSDLPIKIDVWCDRSSSHCVVNSER